MSRVHAHSEVFGAAPHAVFGLLITPSAICRWWSAARAIVIPRSGGVWVATWGPDEDAPDYVTAARIVTCEPPRRLVLGDYQYESRQGPLPFDANFETEFTISVERDGTRLRVEQRGFPDDPAADGFLEACATGWRATFDGIRAHLRATDPGR